MGERESPNLEPSSEPPRTAGELRRRLAEMGDPWQVDPRLADEDAVPNYSRGGDNLDEQPGATIFEGDLSEHLRPSPPSNPFLREVWLEGVLIPQDENDLRKDVERRPAARPHKRGDVPDQG